MLITKYQLPGEDTFEVAQPLELAVGMGLMGCVPPDGWMDGRCDCHPWEVKPGVSHHDGMVPSEAVPDVLPLLHAPPCIPVSRGGVRPLSDAKLCQP